MGSGSPRFRRSSFCNAGGCIEVAVGAPAGVEVRGTTRPNRVPLRFSPEQWAAFVAGVRNGEFTARGR